MKTGLIINGKYGDSCDKYIEHEGEMGFMMPIIANMNICVTLENCTTK